MSSTILRLYDKPLQVKLIIQIPCYNEAETLSIALNDLPKKIEGIDEIEVLIINDGSTDNTVEVAKAHGVKHVVSFSQNRGLAKGFMAGLDACIRAGADIIVNTDADNQYCGEDIAKLVLPILKGEADIVVGARPIMQTKHFSIIKKLLQKLGSWVVRKASRTHIPDAPSGFRAISRKAAMQLKVFSEYTYTLETIIQAGQKGMAITSVPIRTNGDLRPSRLVKSIGSYIKKSIITILRIFVVYRPFRFFLALSAVLFGVGFLIGLRFVYVYLQGAGSGHVQSLILASLLMLMGFNAFLAGVMSDVIAVNRKLLEETNTRLWSLELAAADSSSVSKSSEIKK
jgi:glycosyltransferase involved in cell wall biosynthesis